MLFCKMEGFNLDLIEYIQQLVLQERDFDQRRKLIVVLRHFWTKKIKQKALTIKDGFVLLRLEYSNHKFNCSNKSLRKKSAFMKFFLEYIEIHP